MILILVIGFAGGAAAGMFGIGGGIIFVPALALLVGLHQVQAEGTSLLAMFLVAAVGAMRHYRYGNLQIRDGVITGLLSLVGIAVGVALANVMPEQALRIIFAAVLLTIGVHFLRRFFKTRSPGRDQDASDTLGHAPEIAG